MLTRHRFLLPTLVGAIALALAGCSTPSDRDSGATPAADVATGATAGADATGAEASAGAEGDAAADGDESPTDGEGTDGDDVSDLPFDDLDPDGGGGPDDDAVYFPVTDSILAPECPVVLGPPIEHSVLEQTYTENDGGYECYAQVDSRGDALYVFNLIAEQLEAAGHEQTSLVGGDDGVDAVNVMSFLVGDGELHVTVAQNGATGVLSHFALNSPASGNG